MKKILFLLAAFFIVFLSHSQVMVSNFAGGWDFSGYQDGIGSQAKFFYPRGITIDTNNNLYVADTNNNRIRKITPSGIVTTFAGSGIQGYVDGDSNVAQFNQPWGITIDDFGNVLVADTQNHRIRKITPSGVVTTLAGSGVQGDAIGINSEAKFDTPIGIITKGSFVYVRDQSGKIKVIGGVTSYFAGAGAGYVNGPLSTAKFSGSSGITKDYMGNFYIADIYNNCIRKIDGYTGTVTTYAGSQFGIYGNQNGVGLNSSFHNPIGITTDTSGNVYVADTGNGLIRKITTLSGIVTTLAGIGNSQSYQDGNTNIATFYNPNSLVTDTNGNVFVADSGHNCIRKITGNLSVEENNNLSTIIVYPNPSNDHKINIDSQIALDSIQLINLNGQILLEVKNPEFNNNSYTLENLPQGFYFLKLSSNNQSLTKKVMVN